MAVFTGDQPGGIAPVADSLDGTAGVLTLDDTLQGLGGADTLDGGSGNDTATYKDSAAGVAVDLTLTTQGGTGDEQGDTLVSIENLQGSAFADTLTGDNDANGNVIDGGDGNDVIHGGAGNDTLLGGIDDDRLWGEARADTLDGGSGDDHAHYENSTAGVQVDLNNAGPQVSTGDASGDVLISIESVHGATNFDNLLIGTAATGEHLKGGNFDDTITGNGGTGGDYIDAQGGDDTLIFNSGDVELGTTISGGTGSDTLDVQTSTDFTAAVGFVTGIEEIDIGAGQTATFDSTDIDGQTWAIIAAPGTTETLQVDLSGNSVELSGLTFDNWDDTPFAQFGDGDSVVVNGTTGDDTITGSIVAVTIFGSDGADTLMGGDGNDMLEGGNGADTLNGGAGSDTASYAGATGPVDINLALGTSTDGDKFISIENVTAATNFDSTIFGTGGTNVLSGGDMDDTLTGAQGGDSISGGARNDLLLGNQSDDFMQGGVGDDVLKGGAGDDTIQGDEGNETMIGGASAETYVIESLPGDDLIGQFDKFDVIDVSPLGLFTDLNDVLGAVTDVRGGVTIDFGVGTFTIMGKSTATLDSGDFIF